MGPQNGREMTESHEVLRRYEAHALFVRPNTGAMKPREAKVGDRVLRTHIPRELP